MFEYSGQIVFGTRQQDASILISVQEVRDFITEHGLIDVSQEKLTFVFWIKSLNPTKMKWHIFTEGQVQEMLQYERDRGITPPHKH
jgi:hypothetical protein